MNKDQVKGAVKEAVGNIQQKAGAMTGNTNQQIKGAAKQAEGNVQKNYGNVKQAVKNASKADKY